ncbi:MAG TPA: hypothetical protein VIW94_01045, partial [Acidimicrobiia bacterium]
IVEERIDIQEIVWIGLGEGNLAHEMVMVSAIEVSDTFECPIDSRLAGPKPFCECSSTATVQKSSQKG